MGKWFSQWRAWGKGGMYPPPGDRIASFVERQPPPPPIEVQALELLRSIDKRLQLLERTVQVYDHRSPEIRVCQRE